MYGVQVGIFGDLLIVMAIIKIEKFYQRSNGRFQWAVKLTM